MKKLQELYFRSTS